MITSLWPYSLFPLVQILEGEKQRKSITDFLSMMDFLCSALSIGHFVNFLMITSLWCVFFFVVPKGIERAKGASSQTFCVFAKQNDDFSRQAKLCFSLLATKYILPRGFLNPKA
jgi:hypothetical protein